jgi:FkbM family methyltransferase
MRWRVGASDHGCWLGSFELAKQCRLLEHTRAGTTAYDIGAHAGFYTLLLARTVGKSGRVIAFEPWPAIAAQCLEHVQLNHLSNVVVVPAAIGGARGLASFEAGPSSSTGALATTQTATRVACFTLDELVDGGYFPVPSVVKLDVEGGEGEVLSGAQTLLRGHTVTWFVALHSPAQKSKCLKTFADAGYTVIGIDGEACDPCRPENAPDEIVAVPPGAPV